MQILSEDEVLQDSSITQDQDPGIIFGEVPTRPTDDQSLESHIIGDNLDDTPPSVPAYDGSRLAPNRDWCLYRDWSLVLTPSEEECGAWLGRSDELLQISAFDQYVLLPRGWADVPPSPLWASHSDEDREGET